MKIESGIPVPERKKGYGKWQVLSKQMKDGDSVLLPYYDGKSFLASMYAHGIQPICRQEYTEDGKRMLRVWKMGEY